MSIQAKQCRQNALLCRHFAETTLRPTQAQIFSNSPTNGCGWPFNSNASKPCGMRVSRRAVERSCRPAFNDNKQSSPSNPPNA